MEVEVAVIRATASEVTTIRVSSLQVSLFEHDLVVQRLPPSPILHALCYPLLPEGCVPNRTGHGIFLYVNNSTYYYGFSSPFVVSGRVKETDSFLTECIHREGAVGILIRDPWLPRRCGKIAIVCFCCIHTSWTLPPTHPQLNECWMDHELKITCDEQWIPSQQILLPSSCWPPFQATYHSFPRSLCVWMPVFVCFQFLNPITCQFCGKKKTNPNKPCDPSAGSILITHLTDLEGRMGGWACRRALLAVSVIRWEEAGRPWLRISQTTQSVIDGTGQYMDRSIVAFRGFDLLLFFFCEPKQNAGRINDDVYQLHSVYAMYRGTDWVIQSTAISSAA